MLRIIRASAFAAACALVVPLVARADEPMVALRRPPTSTADATTIQPARAAGAAGPNIGAIGVGGIGGLSEFEIGPSLRYWITERFGLQGHLGFGGDGDFIGEDVEYLRFEPTFIVAIGDFGNAAVNVRPYAGGGIRVFRTDIGSRFDDTTVRPAGVGGVEFGFRGVPRLKVGAELSVSASNDLGDFEFGNGPSIGGARVSALLHYFFD